MNVKIVRIMGVFGLAAPVVGAAMMYMSAASTPGWSPAEETLSALGASGFGAVLFNNGLLMAGALMMLFGSGLYEVCKETTAGRAGAAMYVAASVATVALGLVTINNQPYHNYLAILLFALIPLSMVASSLRLREMGLRLHAALGGIGGAAAAGAILLGPVNGYSELASILALSVWQAALGLWMRGLKES